MSRPFNFFGYTSPPFILQGAFLFNDDFNLTQDWSGKFSGISKEECTFSFSFSGETVRDIDPELYTILKFQYSGDFTGIDLEQTSLSNNIYSDMTGIFLDATSLKFDITGDYFEAPLFKCDLSNNIGEIDYTGLLGPDYYSVRNNIDEVDYSGTFEDGASLLADIASGTFQRIANIEDKTTLDFAWHGLYQKDPGAE